MKKLLFGLVICFAFFLPTQVFANSDSATNLEQTTLNWTYIDGEWYYLDIKTGDKKTGWVYDQNQWYFLNKNGVMKTGWVYDQEKWYFLDNSGAMKTGWFYYYNEWYFLEHSGAMKTGWVYYMDQWYFLNQDGAMSKGWLKDRNQWYFLTSDGSMKTGWIYSYNNWYYLQNNGAMKTGWLYYNGSWYFLSTSGEMATGWYDVNSIWYYSYASGALATNTTIGGYYVNYNGEWVQRTSDPYYVNGILLINKQHGLPSTYAPGENPEARAAFEQMKSAAKGNGLTLNAFSTYRSYSYQGSLYNRYVSSYGQVAADTFSAKPGYSEHQSGLGFDIGGSNSALWAEDGFAYTAEAKWLANNSHQYGFILRYPEGKQNITGYKFEPWHFRYVGNNLSVSIYNSGLTLEEYLGEY